MNGTASKHIVGMGIVCGEGEAFSSTATFCLLYRYLVEVDAYAALPLDRRRGVEMLLSIAACVYK